MNEPSPAASKHTNRLAKEHSPYLLQHAHNPVDWYPWGDEAFARARREDKPIFLSVGYSTCYWCHVMERQSFENDAIAAVMNEHFVSIKVDREERPDVDQLYMTAVQVLTRHGGWPMSVWLTPDLKPFYGGTYFPPTDAHGRPGFVTVLRALADAWQNRRDDVNQSAGQITDILRQLAEPAPPDAPVVIDAALIERLVDRSTGDYDAAHGGFGSAPKFPRQTLLELLLEHNAAHPDEARLKMIRHTLDAMALGGIRDQLGGGFHRYSTDAEWLVPHFEIMLYDNAMLAWCYVEAYRQTEDLFYAEVARGIFDFVLREMTSPDGAFFTALDAEVDAREGLSYLWTRQEIESALPAEDARLFSRVYGLDRGPNFGDPHHGTGRPDRNVLFVADRAAVAPGSESAEKLRAMRQALKRVRDQRKQPMLDTKVITSWNAMMIRALAFGGKILQEPRYLSAAATAADFVLRRHRMPDGRLYRASRDGAGRHHGFIDDYAFLVQALLALRDAGAGEQWKEHAAAVAIVMNQQFADVERGYYFSESGDGGLIVRQKIASDSPLPSGNAVAAMAMLALDQPGDAAGVLKVFAGQLRDQAEAMSAMVQAAGQYVRRHGPLAVEPASTSSAGQRPLSPEQIAREVVQIRTEWASPVDLSLYVDVLRGFHINGHRASPGLIATSLHVSGAEVASIDYPPGKVRRLAFAEAPIELYEGSVRVAIRFSAAPRGPVRIALAYQACDEQACLPPATKTIDVTA